MNYRHAFHAGNFADVMKHVLLVRILTHLKGKATPFRVVDTHAGIGRYDLSGQEANRTAEWQDGIGRLDEPFAAEVEQLIEPFRAILSAVRDRYGRDVYPGSPLLISEAIRPEDRAVFVEKHPDDARLLGDRFRAVANTKVLQLDGWHALSSLIPPRERRGLVLIDPPYEEVGELTRSAEHLASAVRKWQTGIFALWYPIKRAEETAVFAATLSQSLTRPSLRLELLIARPGAMPGLIGSGLIVVNPPWTLAAEAAQVLPVLAERLSREGGGSSRCEVLVPER